MSRINHIDTARGIAILLVVLGHCFHSAEAPLNRVILSFHMPLFFFLSGVFAKHLSKNELVGGAFSKAKRLLIPQITLSLTIIVLKGGLWLSEGKSIADFDFLSCFGFWFLPVLFICSVAFMIVSALVDLSKKGFRIMACISLLLIAALPAYLHLSSEIIPVDWFIKSSVAVFFFFCGAFYKERALYVELEENRIQGLCMILLIAVLVILSQLNTPVKMYLNEYGSFPFFLLSSFVGIWLVLEISKKLTNTAFLNEMGRLSIAVYVWNFLIVGIMLRVVNTMMKTIEMENDGVFSALVFIFSISIIYIISKITYNKLPFLYGIKIIKHD